MKGAISILSYWLTALFALATAPAALAEVGDMFDQSQVIGIVPLAKAGVTRDVYRNIDRIVPKLRKIPAHRVVKLECGCFGVQKQENDVLDTYLIAGRVEKYLREHHKLKLDLWITALMGEQTRLKPSNLIFSVYSDKVKDLDKLPDYKLEAPAE